MLHLCVSSVTDLLVLSWWSLVFLNMLHIRGKSEQQTFHFSFLLMLKNLEWLNAVSGRYGTMRALLWIIGVKPMVKLSLGVRQPACIIVPEQQFLDLENYLTTLINRSGSKDPEMVISLSRLVVLSAMYKCAGFVLSLT